MRNAELPVLIFYVSLLVSFVCLRARDVDDGKPTVIQGVFFIDPNLKRSLLFGGVSDSSTFTSTVIVTGTRPASKLTDHRSRTQGNGSSVSYHLETSSHATMSSFFAATKKPLHLILTAGKAQMFRSATILASVFGPLPVVSIFPHHLWPHDGKRLSNGLISRHGQERKGRALAQLLRLDYTQRLGLQLRQVLVIHGETVSPELIEFYSEMGSDGKELKTLFVTSKISSSEYELGRKYYSSQVVIVDCKLEYFISFSSALLPHGLSDHAWIVFLQDFAEIQSSSILATIAREFQHLNVRIFSFCQTVHGQEGRCTDFSSPASVYYHLLNDTLKALSMAIVTSVFNNDSPLDVYLLSSINRTISVLGGKSNVLPSFGMQCVNTPYGNLALTSGGKGPSKCIETGRVQFQLLSHDVNTSQWLVAANWTASGASNFIAGTNKFGKHFHDPSTFTDKLKVLYGPGYPPFSYSNATGSNYGGVDFDLLYFIAEELGIVKDNIEFTRLNLTKYSWSDMVDLVGQENSSFDMAIGGITATSSRAKISNFSRSYFFSGISILAKKPVSNEINLNWKLFEPFHWTVWILSLTIVLLSSFLFKWFGMTLRYSEGLWLSCIVIFFMNENRLLTMRNIFGRVYVSALSFTVLILVSAYTANLATFLTSQQSMTIGIEDLSSLKRQPVAVYGGELSYKFVTGKTALQNLLILGWNNSVLNTLRNGDAVAYISDAPELISIASRQRPCDLYVVDKEYFPNPFAFPVSSRLFASHGHDINDAITRAVIEGFVSSRYDFHTKYGAICNNVRGISTDEKASGRLNYRNLSGAFFSTLVAAVVCLAAKKVVDLVKQRHRSLKVSSSNSNDT